MGHHSQGETWGGGDGETGQSGTKGVHIHGRSPGSRLEPVPIYTVTSGPETRDGWGSPGVGVREGEGRIGDKEFSLGQGPVRQEEGTLGRFTTRGLDTRPRHGRKNSHTRPVPPDHPVVPGVRRGRAHPPVKGTQDVLMHRGWDLESLGRQKALDRFG